MNSKEIKRCVSRRENAKNIAFFAGFDALD